MGIVRKLRRYLKKRRRAKHPLRHGAPDCRMRDTLDRDKKVIDEDGAPVPWLTYPCIYYLKQLDFSGRSVFEYGVGSSTEFWSARAKRVISVEHDAIWAGKIRALALPNVEVVCTSGQPYVAACDRAAPHDVIVIDGCWRYDCAATCLRALSSDGMVILDNSERYPAITELLRGAGLIQVDFHWGRSGQQIRMGHVNLFDASSTTKAT